MRCSLLFHLGLPRPWAAGDERRMFDDALAQLELADRLGFDGAWVVEHHFLEEASHAAAPDVLLGAASQRTRRLRLGLAAQLPGRHPARLAARATTLDALTGGRLDLGLGEAVTGAEVGGLGLRRATQHEQWEEALGVLARLFVEAPFAGHEGPHLALPPRQLVPRALQHPHPPLWVPGTRRETARVAARHGMGALGLAFVEPEEARGWVQAYDDQLAADRTVPAGFAVTAGVAVALPLHIHAEEAVAIERGVDGVHRLAYALGHFETFGRHRPGRTSVEEEFRARRDDVGLARSVVTADGAPLSVKLLRSGLGSLRGAIGTPDQVRELVGRFEAAGVDELLLTTGTADHEHVCATLELFAAEVLPGVRERHAAHAAAAEERREAAVGGAMRRRAPARIADDDVAFGPKDDGGPGSGSGSGSGADSTLADIAERLAGPAAEGLEAVRRALQDPAPGEEESPARRALRTVADLFGPAADPEDREVVEGTLAPEGDPGAATDPADVPGPAGGTETGPADVAGPADAAGSADAGQDPDADHDATGRADDADAARPADDADAGHAAADRGSDAGPADPAGSAGDAARRGWRRLIEERGEVAFRSIVRRGDDARLERTIGSQAGLKVLFGAMASRFEPEAAAGFTGDLQYDLRTTAGEQRTWTVAVGAQGATAHPGPSADPALVLSLTVADFLRVAAGELDPGAALLGGRMEMRGDFAVALRLAAMFGREP